MSGSDVLKKTTFGAKSEANKVVLTIGNANIKMDYNDAFQLSQWMRLAARQAKTFAGDMSKTWNVAGNLTDAEQNIKDEQKRRF